MHNRARMYNRTALYSYGRFLSRETNSILEAGSVLPSGRRIPTGELWAGNPARLVRKLTHEDILEIPKLAVAINDLMQSHFSEFLPYSTVYLEVEKMKKALSIPL